MTHRSTPLLSTTAASPLLRSLAILMWLLVSCAAQSGVYHTVEPGQTLYRISRAYQVDEQHLARINGIDDPTSLRVGQRLYIPEATRSVAVAGVTIPSAPGGAAKVPAPQASPTPEKKQPEKPLSPSPSITSAKPVGMPKASPPPQVTHPSALQSSDKGRFQWPLRGPLVRSFGSAGGTLNKGIEIASPAGSSVFSAGAGKVIYSGDGVPGYGNLIIIRHDDGFFSVYGFNKRNLVSVGNFVSKGQRIALSGTPPGGGSPRLHFEIRNGKDAVDPIFYLP